MPISGIVVSFAGPVEQFWSTIEQLRQHPALEVGEVRDTQCAVVLDTKSKQHDQEIWDWMHELPGVTNVSVAFIGLEESTD